MNAFLVTQEERDNKQMTEPSSLPTADLPSPHLLSPTVSHDLWRKIPEG